MYAISAYPFEIEHILYKVRWSKAQLYIYSFKIQHLLHISVEI
jgi:hypothetical protein